MNVILSNFPHYLVHYFLKSNSCWSHGFRTWQCHFLNSCTVSGQNGHIWYAAFYKTKKEKVNHGWSTVSREKFVSGLWGLQEASLSLPGPPCPQPGTPCRPARATSPCPGRAGLQVATALPCPAVGPAEPGPPAGPQPGLALAHPQGGGACAEAALLPPWLPSPALLGLLGTTSPIPAWRLEIHQAAAPGEPVTLAPLISATDHNFCPWKMPLMHIHKKILQMNPTNVGFTNIIELSPLP